MELGDRLRTITRYLAANADKLSGTMQGEGYLIVGPREIENESTNIPYIIHGNPAAVLENLITQKIFFGDNVSEDVDNVFNDTNARLSKLEFKPSEQVSFGGSYNITLNSSGELILVVPKIETFEPIKSMYASERIFTQNAMISGVEGDLVNIAKKLYRG